MALSLPQTRKAWIALIGGAVTTGAILWQQYGTFIPGNPQTIAAIGGVLTALAAFWAKNELTTEQVREAQAMPPAPPPAVAVSPPPWL